MRRIFILILLFCSLIASSQQMLTLEQAVGIALNNNFSILIAKNQSDISSNDVSFGNAGIGPQVSFNAASSFASNATKQHYSIGQDVNKEGVVSNNVNYGLALNWTLFDGLKMFANYEKLKELKAMGELNLKIQIENNISEVIKAYYDVVRQKQLIRATSELVSIYEERKKISQEKYDVGSGSRLEVMQAKVDMNAEKSQLLKLQSALFNSKAALNQLLARNSEKDFDAADSIVFAYNPKYGDLKTSVEKKNNGLLFSEENIKIADCSLRASRAMHSPVIGLNANYLFSRSVNDAGFMLLNQNLGFNKGFFVTWNLFNGFEVNRQIKDAQIQLAISKMQYGMIKTQLENNIATAYRNFEQAKEVLQMEEDNSKIVRENIDSALESFRIGKTSSLELKDAQKSYEDAQIRLVNARYDAKSAETELMRLNGMLVK
ncbi:MAG: TolC family protein [Bacteroidetes bacterium]|nr:TolC family protein [Bacteroidota bacterium]